MNGCQELGASATGLYLRARDELAEDDQRYRTHSVESVEEAQESEENTRMHDTTTHLQMLRQKETVRAE